MPHVDEGTLHALLDGELGAAEVLEVQTHFATCAACAARLDEARQMLAETERLVAALEPPAGRAAARAPRLLTGRPMIPVDPVVLIPHNPTPTEVRRSRFKVMAWAASFLVIVGAGFFGLEMRNSLPGNRKPGSLRIRPEEFTFANDKSADSGGSGPGASKPAPAAAPDSLSQLRASSAQALAQRAPSAPPPASATPPASPAPDKGAANQAAPAQPKTPPTPVRTDASPSAAKVGTPVAGLAAGAAAGKAAGGSPPGRTPPPAANTQKTAPAPAAAAAKGTDAPEPSDESKATDDQAAQRSQPQSAEDGAASVDRAMSDKATADLDREQMRQRAAAATAALDREREERAAAEEAARRQEAAAAESSPPTVDQKANVSRRIGLDEAARQLGGPLHAIDGMTRQLVGLVRPQVVPGADTARAVVRAVYVDRNGRTLYLDQQRVRPGQLDLPFTPQVGPNGQLSWMAGSVLLVLQSDLPQDSLRALARRVR